MKLYGVPNAFSFAADTRSSFNNGSVCRLSQLITFPIKCPVPYSKKSNQDYYFHKQALHVCTLAHSTKAAIALRTNGTPVTAALAAPPALEELFNEVDGATGVAGSVVGTLSATVGATDSVTDVAMTEDRT